MTGEKKTKDKIRNLIKKKFISKIPDGKLKVMDKKQVKEEEEKNPGSENKI